MKNEKQQRPKHRISPGAIVCILALVMVPILINLVLDPRGGGYGTYNSYAGPVMPMTSLSGGEDVTVTRNVNFDFSSVRTQEETLRDSSTAVITDSYVLTNVSNDTVTAELVYGFEGQFIDEPAYFPVITVDGEPTDTEIYPSVDEGSLLFTAPDFEAYRDAIMENDFLSIAMAQTPQWDAKVKVYHFTELAYAGEEPLEDVFLSVAYTMDENTSLWVRQYDVSRTDSSTNRGQLMFRVDRGEAWLFVMGNDLQDMEIGGNLGYNITQSSAAEGISYQLETYESTFTECLWAYAREYNFWEDQSGYPDPGLITPELLYDGAMKKIAGTDSQGPEANVHVMSEVFYSVVTDVRMMYLVFRVDIPAGGEVTVSARYEQEASYDFGGAGKVREGYDMATELDSNLHFTEQSASVSNFQRIEILDQNFGFDLEKEITHVALDMEVERYYMDIALKA